MSAPTTSDMAARLRHQASNHTTVLTLKRDLPQLAEDGVEAPGLFVDTTHAPGMVVNGELRVSVVRLYSVDASGRRELVGQIQATRVLDHPLANWKMNFFLHVHKYYATHKVEDDTQWFLRVLEQHYKNGGDEVEIASLQVPA